MTDIIGTIAVYAYTTTMLMLTTTLLVVEAYKLYRLLKRALEDG